MPDDSEEIFFYPPALVERNKIWDYSSQWGEDHADQYIDSFYDGLEKQQKESEHSIFPNNKTKTDVYYFKWQFRPDTPKHTVFYRIFPSGNMGVVAIIGAQQQTNDRFHEAMEKVEPIIQAQKKK